MWATALPRSFFPVLPASDVTPSLLATGTIFHLHLQPFLRHRVKHVFLFIAGEFQKTLMSYAISYAISRVRVQLLLLAL